MGSLEPTAQAAEIQFRHCFAYKVYQLQFTAKCCIWQYICTLGFRCIFKLVNFLSSGGETPCSLSVVTVPSGHGSLAVVATPGPTGALAVGGQALEFQRRLQVARAPTGLPQVSQTRRKRSAGARVASGPDIHRQLRLSSRCVTQPRRNPAEQPLRNPTHWQAGSDQGP